MSQSKKQSKPSSAKSSQASAARNPAENVVRLGGGAVKDFIETSSHEAQKAQDKVLKLSRESTEQLVKSADNVSKALQELASLSRDNAETCVECNNLAASLARDLGSETLNSVNRVFSDSVELSKDFLSCRTLNDMIELQTRFFQQSLDGFFNQTSRFSGLLFEYSSEAMEPLNERVATTTEKLQKAMAA